MRVLLIVLTLMLATPGSARAADVTDRLLAELASCDPNTIATTGPRLDLLLALADGRSAADLGQLLRDPRPCLGRVSGFGRGADEIVLVGGTGTYAFRDLTHAVGAVLWVDRGYWRAAHAPLGYLPGVIDRPGITAPISRPDGHEYFIGISSGGSAGAVGFAAITINGASARTTLDFDFGGELSDSRLLGDGRLYVEGRRTTDRALTWFSHAGWPNGAQWLFERRDGRWTPVAERQALHPYYLLTGLIAGMATRDLSVMLRFASPAVVAEAVALPRPTLPYVDFWGSYPAQRADADLTRGEIESWDALPDHGTPASGPVARIVRYGNSWDSRNIELEVTFERDATGWEITKIDFAPPPTPGSNTLVP